MPWLEVTKNLLKGHLAIQKGHQQNCQVYTYWDSEISAYLEGHPMTCKWLITMVSFRPLSRVGLVIHCFVTSLTNHLLSGVILQVGITVYMEVLLIIHDMEILV